MTEYQREGLSSAEKYKRENEVKQSEMRAKMEYKQIKSERKMMEDDYYYEYRRGRGNGETEASTASAEETTETTAPATATTTTTTSTSTSANTVDSLGVIHFGDEDEEEEEEELMTEEEEEEEGVPSENEELVEYASESYQNDSNIYIYIYIYSHRYNPKAGSDIFREANRAASKEGIQTGKKRLQERILGTTVKLSEIKDRSRDNQCA